MARAPTVVELPEHQRSRLGWVLSLHAALYVVFFFYAIAPSPWLLSLITGILLTGFYLFMTC